MLLWALSTVITAGPLALIAIGNTPHLQQEPLLRLTLVQAVAIAAGLATVIISAVLYRVYPARRYWLYALIGIPLVGATTLLLAREELISLYQMLTRQFRASGRFIWPHIYILVGLGIVGLWRYYSRRAILVITVIAILVQYSDTAPLRRTIKNNIEHSKIVEAEYAPWRPYFDRAESFHVFPYYGCPGYDPGRTLLFQVLAAERSMRYNTAYYSRGDYRCRTPEDDFSDTPMQPGTLYLFMPPHQNDEQIKQYLPAGMKFAQACVRHPWGTLCLPGRQIGASEQISPPFDRIAGK